jgi:histidinol-phosphate aminotransferase
MDQFGNREDVFIVFDEAYTEFVRHKEAVNTLELFKKYNNVIVLRTFSKIYALAGLRLGVLFAPAQVVDNFNA